MSLTVAVEILRQGGLVGLPTETVYGLAADATDATAVLRIFSAKGRPSFDPLIVHVDGIAMARTVAEVDAAAAALMERFWPGPLTLVLPRLATIPDVVSSGLPTVAVRCPDHPLALALIRELGRPLAAPSANRFGCLSPTSAAAVVEQLGEAVDLVLDGGPCRVGVESTVLRLTPHPLVLRPGGVTLEELQDALGRDILQTEQAARDSGLPPEAPGMLAHHYAPHTPLRLKAPKEPWTCDPSVARLSFSGRDLPGDGGPSLVLSPGGDLVEAAAGLFAALRQLDAQRCRCITAELVPEVGLGLAINDRLRRAAN